MKKHIKKVTQSSSRRLPALLFAVVFASLGVYILAFTHAATAVNLSLSPASSAVNLGSNLTVTVSENSNTSSVYAVLASLSYDKTKLQFVSIDTSATAFGVEAESSGGNGTVTLARGVSGGASVTGTKVVGAVTFKAIATGGAAVTVNGICANTTATGCSAVSDNNGVQMLTAVSGGTYTINDGNAPTVPTGLNAGVTATSANLTWTASTDNVDVTGYNIYRNGAKIATSATNSYVNTGLTPSTSYSYTVQAYDAAGNTSAQSTALVATTTGDTVDPTTPTGLKTTAVSTSSATLTWTASTDNVDVTGYNIYRNGAKIATSATNSYTNSGLTAGSIYSYAVEAYDAAGNVSAKSTALSVNTVADTAAPGLPTNLAAPTKTHLSATLTWTASTDNVGVTGYNIYRNGAKIGSSVTSSYNSTGLKAGTTYTYSVQAYDAAGNVSAKTTNLTVTLGIKAGDVNRDDQVNITDLSILAGNYDPAASTQNATHDTGDLNGDGVVNIFDLGILCGGWGK
jgi:chitodextrinase